MGASGCTVWAFASLSVFEFIQSEPVMKKFAFASAAFALMATSITPAMAVTVPFSSLPAAQQMLAQTTCNGFIPGNSPFVATPTALDDTVTVGFETSRVTITSIQGGQEIGRTPYVLTAGSEHRNGQSPNIFGDFTSIVTFSGGLLIQQVTTVDRHKVTFGCALSKDNGETFPNGKQVENTGALFVNFNTNTRTFTDTVSAPNTTQTFTEDRVICISPTKNPGVWRQQNGYTLVCNTMKYLAVGMGAGTHSNSVPGLAPLRPNAPDHEESMPMDSLVSWPLAWDGEV